jgi:hypothetical protein
MELATGITPGFQLKHRFFLPSAFFIVSALNRPIAFRIQTPGNNFTPPVGRRVLSHQLL